MLSTFAAIALALAPQPSLTLEASALCCRNVTIGGLTRQICVVNINGAACNSAPPVIAVLPPENSTIPVPSDSAIVADVSRPAKPLTCYPSGWCSFDPELAMVEGSDRAPHRGSGRRIGSSAAIALLPTRSGTFVPPGNPRPREGIRSGSTH